MKIRDLAYETAAGLDANRVRSALTVLGIVIGIAAVIVMTSLVGGVRVALIEAYGFSQARMVMFQCYYDRDMTLDDVEQMRTDMAGVYEIITPTTSASAKTLVKKKKEDIQCIGAYAEFATVQNFRFAQGRFFTKKEVEDESLVAVITQDTVKSLFGNADKDVLGEHLYLDNKEYTIVGVLQSITTTGGDGMIMAYIPYTTCIKQLEVFSKVDQMYGLAYEGSNMKQVAAKTERWLAAQFNVPEEDKEMAIYVTTLDAVIGRLNAMMETFRILILAVASISLLVGGIGIMNMMLTNVTERIREIGLRKALGARRGDITRQFLLESVCLTFVGGIVGIIAGVGLSYPLANAAGNAIAQVLSGQEFAEITPVIDPLTVLAATGISIAIGIIFGYYPARRAAKLDPVESLRYQ